MPTVYDMDYPVPSERVRQQDTPNTLGWWDGADVPRPPCPSVGGVSGRPDSLGWNTGLRWTRMQASPITGRTLVPPATRPNPKQGRVGFSDTQGMLYSGVQSQNAAPPTVEQVAQAILHPVNVGISE